MKGRKNIPVTLTWRENLLAAWVACQRNTDGVKAHADGGKFGYDGSTLDLHHKGALYELVAAKGLDRYWTGAGLGFYDDADVGRWQVRGTEHEDGRLLVRPNEGHLDQPWLLVTGSFPHYILRGWCYGREARKDEYLDAPAGRPPAYFAPQLPLKGF